MSDLIQVYGDLIKTVLEMNEVEYICASGILIGLILSMLNIAFAFQELAKEAYKVCGEILEILKNTQGYAPMYITHTAKKFIWLLIKYNVQTVKLIVIFPFWFVNQEWGITLALCLMLHESYNLVKKVYFS